MRTCKWGVFGVLVLSFVAFLGLTSVALAQPAAVELKYSIFFPAPAPQTCLSHLGQPLITAFQRSFCLKSLVSFVATGAVGSHTTKTPTARRNKLL